MIELIKLAGQLNDADRKYLFLCMFDQETFEVSVKNLLELQAAIRDETGLESDTFQIRYKSNGKELSLKTQLSFETFSSKQPNTGDGFEVTIITNEEHARLKKEAAEQDAELKKETAAKEAQLKREAALNDVQLRREAADKEAERKRIDDEIQARHQREAAELESQLKREATEL